MSNEIGLKCGSPVDSKGKSEPRSIPRREAAQGVPASKRASKA